MYLAKLALHFNDLPTNVSTSKINEYLFLLSKAPDCPSSSSFKCTVYGLRFAYKIKGLTKKIIRLPTIQKEKKLPVVLSKREMKCLLEVPKMIKHRALLGLLYGCGLRCGEVRNIKISDLDFDRRMLHVRQGKGKKDRYVPLSVVLIEILLEYLREVKPLHWLFNGKPNKRKDGFSQYSEGGVQSVIRYSSKAVGILKQVSTHTLRHTFATHLLEDGLDIISIKELLGHSKIETTMVYLHVAQCEKSLAFSPIDTLYGIRKKAFQFQCPYATSKKIEIGY